MASPPGTRRPSRPERQPARTAAGAANPQHAAPIEDYALIGDCHSAALVSRDGSIDWLCWPRFDSPACFAALVGTPDNGRWRIAPAEPPVRVSRQYRPGTMILETVFDTKDGSVALIDFMTAATGNSSVVRIVEGRSGQVAMRLDLALRFDYGSAVPWVTQSAAHTPGCARSPGPMSWCCTAVRTCMARNSPRSASSPSRPASAFRSPCRTASRICADPVAPDADDGAGRDRRGWARGRRAASIRANGASRCMRSLLTLKALTYYPTGGIVAAPTTSLPELPGGERNWDYRYCWLRDATFTLLALMHAGYREEAQAWGAWLRRSVAGTPSQIQTLYGLAGERWLMEWEVPWLAGYGGARPVRIGNAASAQLQLDVYGELMDALYQEMHLGLARPNASWDIQRALVTHLAEIWEQPDESIWEVRGGQRHFTFSKVMAWVAMDRAIRGAEEFGMPARLEQWRALRQRIHDSVCREGYNAEKRQLRAVLRRRRRWMRACCCCRWSGFLPPEDPRIKGTVAAIQRELTVDGLVLRYRTHEAVSMGCRRARACSSRAASGWSTT